ENPAEEKRAESALRRARTDWIEREQLAAAPMFGHARAVLPEAGVPEEVIDTQIVARNPNESLHAAILEVAHETHDRTVAAGYAAFSWFQDTLHRHLAEVLLQKAAGTAVWIVH